MQCVVEYINCYCVLKAVLLGPSLLLSTEAEYGRSPSIVVDCVTFVNGLMSSKQRQCHGDITTSTVRSRLRSPAGHSIYRSPLDRVTITGGDQKDERELAGRVTRPCGTQNQNKNAGVERQQASIIIHYSRNRESRNSNLLGPHPAPDPFELGLGRVDEIELRKPTLDLKLEGKISQDGLWVKGSDLAKAYRKAKQSKAKGTTTNARLILRAASWSWRVQSEQRQNITTEFISPSKGSL